MNSKNWGNSLWIYIHTICLLTDTKDPHEIKDCLRSISDVIPCLACRYTYKEMCKDLDTLDCSGNNLFWWSVDIHNRVNKNIGKKEFSYNEAQELYLNK